MRDNLQLKKVRHNNSEVHQPYPSFYEEIKRASKAHEMTVSYCIPGVSPSPAKAPEDTGEVVDCHVSLATRLGHVPRLYLRSKAIL